MLKAVLIACTTTVLAVPCGCTSDRTTIMIDGSSTVFPIVLAVAEEFRKVDPDRIAIGVSGTGGGFKKFCRAESVITGASRPITASERVACDRAGIDYIELPVAYDGIAVVVDKDNHWVDHLTVAELRKMWSPASAAQGIDRWSQIRAGWPDLEFHLFGPGADSGTYDYFTKAIVGQEKASRGDFTASENDNLLVQGIATDEQALGFFGFAYYAENRDRLRLVPIDDGDDHNGRGPIAPSVKTVKRGTYQPLSRPVFVYVSARASHRQDVDAFMEFFLTRSRPLIREVGYIPLPDRAQSMVVQRYRTRTTGSLFESGSKVGVSVADVLGGK